MGVVDGYAGRRLQEGYDSFEIKPRNSGQGSVATAMVGGVSSIAGAFVIRSVDQILPYCVISAEYPECIKVGGLQSKSRQARAAAMAKAKPAGKPLYEVL